MSTFGGNPGFNKFGRTLTPHALPDGGVVDARGRAGDAFGGGPNGEGGAPLLAAMLDRTIAFRYTEDFLAGADEPVGWSLTEDGTPAHSIDTRAGGWQRVVTGGTDNNESYFLSRKIAKFDTDKDLWFEAVFQHAAGSTAGKSSVVVGLSSVNAANTITDAGGIVATFDGAVFLKGEDDTKINFISSNASAQVSGETADWTEDAITRVGFYFDADGGAAAGVGKLTPYVNGEPYPSQEITLAGLEEMGVLLGVKTHEGAGQILKVDYVDLVQVR